MAFSFGTKHSNGFVSKLIAISVIVLAHISFAQAAGDAAQGLRDYDYTCRHCHGSPQPGKTGAFSDFDITANRLSVYASNPAAIAKAANEGYVIPEGNSNDDYLPGAKTNQPMRSFSGNGAKKFGTTDAPSTYVINISAYLASLFSAPGAPTIGSVTVGNAEATVNFTAPKSDLTITSYTVTANPGGITATGTASPITVPGLTNGTAYTFTVTATSNAGSSKPSTASNSAAPNAPVVAAAPVAPAAKVVPPPAVASQAAPLAQAKTVAPVMPIASTNQAKTITPFVPNVHAKVVVPVVPITPLAAQTKIEKQVPAAIVAQANSTAPIAAPVPEVAPVPVAVVAPAAVTATNNVVSAQSAPPSHHSANKTVVPAPTMKMARAGNSSARVFFGAPADSPNITSYTVTVLSDGKSTGITATGTKSPITITGLTNGSAYTLTVTANTSAGSSEASDQSNAVTPLKILGD